MIYLHDLKPAEGSHHRKRRVGRGIAGKGGKTAGRGTKGQGARDTVPVGFEGGQLPLTQRTPKLRGFRNPFRVSYTVVNLDQLARLGDEGMTEIEPASLVARGVVRRGALVKVCARGEVHAALVVRAHAFSQAAKAAIEAAGGRVETVAVPFKGPRPRAAGSALSNR